MDDLVESEGVHAVVMTYRDDLQVPPDAKGWRGARPWIDLEQAAVGVLAHQASRAGLDTVIGFTLIYVPYSPLGDAEGGDLSWEVDPHVFGGSLGLAEHPATALEETIETVAVNGPGTAPARWDEVLQRWRGWSQLLADLARLSCHLPDPLFATIDISVEHVVGSDQFTWTIEIPVIAEDGWWPSAWTAPDPIQVLRTTLEESEDWLSGHPAGHHLADDDTATT